MVQTCPTCLESHDADEIDEVGGECAKCRACRRNWLVPLALSLLVIGGVWLVNPARGGDAIVGVLGFAVTAQGWLGLWHGRFRTRRGIATGMQARAMSVFAILVGVAMIYLAWNHPERTQ